MKENCVFVELHYVLNGLKENLFDLSLFVISSGPWEAALPCKNASQEEKLACESDVLSVLPKSKRRWEPTGTKK